MDQDQRLRQAAKPLNAITARINGEWELNPDPTARAWFQDADCIFGHNTDNDTLVLFYGRDVLKQIVKTNTPKKTKVIVLSYSGFTEELEAFCAACDFLRGRCDYQGHDGFVDDVCDKLFNA